MDNLRLAYQLARKEKLHYTIVKRIDRNPDKYLTKIQRNLIARKYRTGKYRIFENIEGRKLRKIQALPFYPDRIVHHAIMNVCGDFWRKSLIRDTFQSLPGRGQSDVFKRVRGFIDQNNPKYFLQIDIKKFYPSSKNQVVEDLAISKFIKCKDTLTLLKEILWSITGLPIGSFLSQIWGNLELSPTDWFIKQTLRVKGYFRYCDDLVFFGDSPKRLREVLREVVSKLEEIGLTVKPDWVIQDVRTHGLDFCGYVFKSKTTRLRSHIKYSFIESAHNYYQDSINSYNGWLKPIQDKHLWDYVKN